MTNDLTTVVICAYNAEATIGETLSALFCQTTDQFEVVVVDDGSTDRTAATVAAAAAEAPVAVRTVTTPHAGLAAARNRGVAEASTKYLMFVDADDLLEPTAIAALMAAATESGADIVICDIRYTDFESGEEMHVHRQGDPALYRGRLADSPGLLPLLSASACGKLFARTLFETSEIRFPDGRVFEDLWTVFRLCAVAASLSKVDEPLYEYRQARAGSLMCGYDDRYLDMIDGLSVTNDFFIQVGISGPLADDMVVFNFYHALHGRYTNLLQFGSTDVRHRYLRRAFSYMNAHFPQWRSSSRVRQMCGGRLRTTVFTSRLLLTAWTDLRARRGQQDPC